MRLVITDGTAQPVITTDAVAVAGKTGTGEVGLEDQWHAWFAAYGPYGAADRDDQIVVVVMVEAVNVWEWWAAKAANLIFHAAFSGQTVAEAVDYLKPWYGDAVFNPLRHEEEDESAEEGGGEPTGEARNRRRRRRRGGFGVRAASGTAKRTGSAGILGSGFSALRAVDPILLLPTLALVGTGILFVYSSGGELGRGVGLQRMDQADRLGVQRPGADGGVRGDQSPALQGAHPVCLPGRPGAAGRDADVRAAGQWRALLAGHRRTGHPAVRVRQDRDHPVPGRLPVGDRQRHRGTAALPDRAAGGGWRRWG